MNYYRKIRRLTLIVFLVLFVAANLFAQQQKDDYSFYIPSETNEHYPLIKDSKVKNVILLIGDGMGFATVDIARTRAAGAGGVLYMERLPVAGYLKTHSIDTLYTDSAAAGTALASGIKTKNGMISITPDGRKYESIMKAAMKKGLAAGLVATSAITHATPAVFAANVKNRGDEDIIAEHMIDAKINVLLGGGMHFFIPQSVEGSKRKDEKDLIRKAIEEGYKFLKTKDEMFKAEGEYILGLFQLNYLTTYAPEPSLAEMSDKAIELLNKDRDGFFLMIEGSQIDWESHDNSAEGTIRQTLLFDIAVKNAVDFALKDRETLVIVTADHETGGIVIAGGNLEGGIPEIIWGTGHHSGVSVPLYAFGPGAEKFMGAHDNTDIPKIIAGLLNIKDFPIIIN